MKISLRIETKDHDATAQRAKHEKELHETNTMHAICGATLEFLGQLADRAARERERAREEARGWGAGSQKEGPPLQ